MEHKQSKFRKFWAIFMAILVILAIIGVSWITYKVTTKKFENKVKLEILKPDTVYIPEIFTIPEPYEVIMSPTVIRIYEKDTTSKYNEFSLREKDLVLTTPNQLDSILISKEFLKSFPLQPKLLHLDLTKNQLSLGLLDTDGTIHQDLYPLDLSNYQYQWTSNQFSKKKIRNLKLEPTIGYQYRPLNNLHDIDINLNLKTNGFNYKFGLNGFYYPRLQNQPSWDFVIGITYNLKGE